MKCKEKELQINSMKRGVPIGNTRNEKNVGCNSILSLQQYR